MKYLFSFFIMAILLNSCGNSSSESHPTVSEDKAPAVIVEKKIDKRALQKQYAHFYESRNNWFRANRIREKGKVNAFDEALKDTSFFVFREQLLDAIKQKSILDLVEKLEDDIIVSADSLKGIPTLLQQWHLTTPDSIEQSNIWVALHRILRNGGYFDHSKNKFIAPYYAENKGLAPTQACILGQGVRIRNRPGLNAAVVRKVSYDIVEIKEVMDKKERIGEEVFPWVHIQLPSGEQGYIWGKFLGSSHGEKIIFQKDQNDNWMMHTFYSHHNKR